MRRSVLAAAMAASLTVGGAAGVALFTPSLSGADTDETATDPDVDRDRPLLTERIRERLDDLVTERVRERLDDLVAADVISGDQADAVAEHLAEQSPFRDHRGVAGGPGLRFGDAVLDTLGLDPAELREQLRSGDSIGDIAEANGLDVDAVIEAVVSAHRDRLADAVADGRISQQEADEQAAAFEDRFRALVERFAERGTNRHGQPGS